MKIDQEMKRILSENKSKPENAEMIADLRAAIKESTADSIQEENERLRSALSDMLLLIAEHGGKVMQSHATRIEAARKVLYRDAEALRWIKELENYGLG